MHLPALLGRGGGSSLSLDDLKLQAMRQGERKQNVLLSYCCGQRTSLEATWDMSDLSHRNLGAGKDSQATETWV